MRERCRRSDAGSVSLFVVVLAVALLAAVGLVVDGGAKIRALERADQAAREAARAGSQMIDVPAAVRGDPVALNPAVASGAAEAYLDAAGVEGTVRVAGNAVTVWTRVPYAPVFLGVIGVRPTTVTGAASARPVSRDEEEVP